MNWPLAKLIQLISGRDYKVRVACVKKSKGELDPLLISSMVQIDNTRCAPRVREQKIADKNQSTTLMLLNVPQNEVELLRPF